MSKEPDRIFAQPLAQVPDFAFNEDVVRVFPDMIKRSVPGYPTIVENMPVFRRKETGGIHNGLLWQRLSGYSGWNRRHRQLPSIL